MYYIVYINPINLDSIFCASQKINCNFKRNFVIFFLFLTERNFKLGKEHFNISITLLKDKKFICTNLKRR